MFYDVEKEPGLEYPPVLEEWLQGEPTVEYTDEVTGKKVMPDVKDFFGLGRSDINYHLHGRIHGLPPQQGIPGFQRISMMKYLPDCESKYGTGRSSYWAYEGCVLPGNQIILGRWWCPIGAMESGRSYCGPFIFWNVPGLAEDKMKTVNDALAFLDHVEMNTLG